MTVFLVKKIPLRVEPPYEEREDEKQKAAAADRRQQSPLRDTFSKSSVTNYSNF